MTRKLGFFSVPPVLEGSLWESLNYTLGSHVDLLCEASGVPVPSITWLKDGTPIGKQGWEATEYKYFVIVLGYFSF